MTIIIKNKETLIFQEFNFKCCIGKMEQPTIKLKVTIKHLKDYFLWEMFIIEKIEI